MNKILSPYVASVTPYFPRKVRGRKIFLKYAIHSLNHFQFIDTKSLISELVL